MFSGALILAARKGKGLSQEALAEQSGVSLRTIQRAEQGETVPRGHTMQQLAQTLGVPLDALRLPPPAVARPGDGDGHAPLPSPAAVPPALRADPHLLELLNLSALSLLVFPLLNLVVPWLVWRARRHDTLHVAGVGRRVLGFQLLWQVGCFFWLLALALGQVVAARIFGLVVPGLFIGGLFAAYALNVLAVLHNARRLRHGHLDLYQFGRRAKG